MRANHSWKASSSCLYLPRIYKLVMTSLQSSTKAANWLPKEQKKHFCFSAFLQTFHFVACFLLPSNCKCCFQKKTLSEFSALVYVMNGKGGWRRGVSHEKDNALLQHAWFDSCRRMTLLGYYRFS